MAEGGGDLKKSINELEKEVTCGICQECFKEPKLLPCGHYFCKQCIVKLRLKKPAGNPFSCPECRTEFDISQDAVENLKTAFHVNRLMDIHRSQLEFYDAENAKASVVSTTKSDVSSKCTEHGDFMKLYCYSCERFICRDCALTKHKHHKYEYNTTAVPKRREELLLSEASFSKIEKKFQGALVKVRGRVAEVETSGQQVEDFITSYFKQLHDILSEKEAFMKKQYKAGISTKISKLKAQEKKLTEASLLSLVHLTQGSQKYYKFELTPVVSMHSDVAYNTSPTKFSKKFETFLPIYYHEISCEDQVSIKEYKDKVYPNEQCFFHICSLKKNDFSVNISGMSKCQVSRIGCYTYLVEYVSPRNPGSYNIVIYDDGNTVVCTKRLNVRERVGQGYVLK